MMATRNSAHQSRLVVETLIIYKEILHLRWVDRFLNYQQYDLVGESFGRHPSPLLASVVNAKASAHALRKQSAFQHLWVVFLIDLEFNQKKPSAQMTKRHF